MSNDDTDCSKNFPTFARLIKPFSRADTRILNKFLVVARDIHPIGDNFFRERPAHSSLPLGGSSVLGRTSRPDMAGTSSQTSLQIKGCHDMYELRLVTNEALSICPSLHWEASVAEGLH